MTARIPARLPAAALVILLGWALLPMAPAAAQEGETTQVSATASLTFEPMEVTVAQGTTVEWVYEGGGAHTVTFTDSLEEREPNGEFDEELTAESGPVQFTFDEPGTYHYYCQPHTAAEMMGTVIVEAEDGGDGDGGDADGGDADGGAGDGMDDSMGGDAMDDSMAGDDGAADDDSGRTPAPGVALVIAALGLFLAAVRRRS